MSLMYVKIHYGPYVDLYTCGHRPQKLTGVRDSLLKLGYRVNLKPCDSYEKCVFEVCGYSVFSCNIRNLQFNLSLDQDPVGQRAVEAVVDATEKMSRTRCYLWTWQLIDDQLFKRSKYSSTDHWLTKMDIKPLNIVCKDCCNLLVARRDATPYKFTEQDSGSENVMFPFDGGDIDASPKPKKSQKVVKPKKSEVTQESHTNIETQEVQEAKPHKMRPKFSNTKTTHF